jgi:hypothetical protein
MWDCELGPKLEGKKTVYKEEHQTFEWVRVLDGSIL